jgi:hypothetical protein
LGSRHPSFASRNVVATARGVISFAHQNVFCHVERAAWLSIRSADYRNPCNYVFLLVYDDDDVAAILIIVVRKVIGNDFGVGHGIGGIGEWRSLVVFDGESAARDVEKVSRQNRIARWSAFFLACVV